jgi:hypothetical protein
MRLMKWFTKHDAEGEPELEKSYLCDGPGLAANQWHE